MPRSERTIIAVDHMAYRDGKVFNTDCAPLVALGIHAIQFYKDHAEIEYIDHIKPNAIITDMRPYQRYFDQGRDVRADEPPVGPDMRRLWDPIENVLRDGDGNVVEGPPPPLPPLENRKPSQGGKSAKHRTR